MVEIPGHRFTGRRGGDLSADANCPSPRSLTPWTTPVSMSSAANGDGFIGASRQGSVVTC